MSGPHWDKWKLERLAQLVAKGLTSYEIARELGVTRNSVIGKVKRTPGLRLLGPAYSRPSGDYVWDEATTTKLREFAKSGISRRQAARHIGCSDESLRRRIAKLGLFWRDPVGLHRPSTLKVQQAKPSPPKPTYKPKEYKHDRPLISLMQLTSTTCRWPIGEVMQPGFGFCGQEIASHQVYCDHHARIAQAPGQSSQKLMAGNRL